MEKKIQKRKLRNIRAIINKSFPKNKDAEIVDEIATEILVAINIIEEDMKIL